MSLLSSGGDWQAHPQGFWVGKVVDIKATKDTYGDKIRWFFETNCRDDDDKPRRVSMKSGYTGLGNEKAWLNRLLLALGHDPKDAYWTSFDTLDGFKFLIDRGTRCGLEVKHYEKSDGSLGDNVADVMTLEQLEQRKAELRASLDAESGNGYHPGTPPPVRNAAGAPPSAPPPPPGGGTPPPPGGRVPVPAGDAPAWDDPFADE